MGIPIFQADSLTEVPLRGNPAGICLLERAAQNEWMQAARQLSPRTGVIRMKIQGDRVYLAGRAVTVFSGELAV